MANRYEFSHSRNLNGAHLGFSSGLQSDLNYMISAGTASEGTFYLTTDTHRLYIGRTVTADSQVTDGTFTTKTIPIPVNEGIQTVSGVSDLPSNANAGEFYYIDGSNILAVYNGTQWVQINPNTNTDTMVSGVSISNGATIYKLTEDQQIVAGKTYYTENNNVYSRVESPTVSNISTYYEPDKIRYTLTLNQSYTNKITNSTDGLEQPNPITVSFDIKPTDMASILNVSAGLTRAAVSDNTSVISLDGGISNGRTVALKGGTNISLSTSDADTIEIIGADYDLARGSISSDTVPIKLKKGNADDSSINFTAGNILTLDSTDATGITIHHGAPGAATQTVSGTDDQYGETTNTTKELNGNTSQTIKIPTIKKDTYGHIQSISETSVTLRGIKQVETSSTLGKVYLIDQNNANIAESSEHALSYNITVDGTTSQIDNKGNLGSFYSATGVDAKIAQAFRGANALTYKGTVGRQGSSVLSLPIENVQNGDTYLVDAGIINIYTKTKDTSIQNGKKYYVESSGSFAEVDSPQSANLNTYYEKVNSQEVSSGDLFIAVGDEYQLSVDTSVNSLKEYYTRSGSEGAYTYTKVTSPTGNPSTSNYYENTGIIQDYLTWTYVPSGNDQDSRYNLTSNTNTISLHEINGNDINGIKFISGNKIYPANIYSEEEGGVTNFKVAFNHDTSTAGISGSYGAEDDSATAGTLGSNNEFRVPNIAVDAYGHITGASTSTYSIPNPTYKLINNTSADGTGTYGTTINLFKDNSADSGSIGFSGDSTGGVALSVDGTNHNIKINHTTLTTTTDSTLTSVSGGTSASFNNTNGALSFDVITALQTDSYGHLSKYKVSNFTLPSYTLYSSGISSNTATIKLQRDNSDIGNSIQLTSHNLTITSNTSNNINTYTFDLEWGSFSTTT